MMDGLSRAHYRDRGAFYGFYGNDGTNTPISTGGLGLQRKSAETDNATLVAVLSFPRHLQIQHHHVHIGRRAAEYGEAIAIPGPPTNLAPSHLISHSSPLSG
ncbi:hypothetical protein V493_05623 [Pseudogymnoascus sp. VKM F-4281 (FW-2241)]|nr:hypothetical protein V493_05623 [Pseudogymnoascus sp. VKM F-4281 (FW-2241)]